MKIAYNPEATALTAAPSNNDITFDLAGKAIYARGVKFEGTNTTYSVFKKHTSDNSGGYNGLVPVPSYTTTTIRYLREDGNWEVPIMSEAVTDLGTDGNYITWTKNDTVNKLTVPYAITAHTIEGFTRRATVNCTWGTLTASNEYTPVYWGDTASGGGIGFSDKDGKTYLQIDGDYYANEGSSLVLHTANYNSYAPTLTGTGASGTWEIDINGTATSSTSANYSRNLLGRKTSGGDYDAVAGNLIFAEWNTHNDNRWYLKAEGYETRVAYATSAGSLGSYNISNFMVYADHPDYVAASFTDENLSKKAGEKYIEYWDSAGGWFNSAWGQVTANYGFVGNLTGTASYATSAGSADTASTANYINYTTRADKGNGTAQFCQYSGETNNPTNDWYSHIIMNHNNSAGYYTEIATCFHSDSVYFRRQSNGTTYAWKKFAWTSDIPTVTDYYWANVQVSSSSNPNTSPTFASATVTDRINATNYVFLNPNGSGIYLNSNSLNWHDGSAYKQSLINFTSDGKVGIGTATPSYKLDVTNNAKIASICFEKNDEINRYGGDLYLQHRGTIEGSQGSARTGNILMVNNGGNVGIGTISPTSVLDVVGEVAANYYKYKTVGSNLPHSSGDAWYNVYQGDI
jgi:hypothetical protein